MRNPTRTTKPERRAARQCSPIISRYLGVGIAARLRRSGTIMNDGDALDRLADVFEAVADPPPPDLNARVAQALAQSREQIALALDVPPEHITPGDAEAVAERNAANVAQALTEQVLRPELERLGLDADAYEYTYVRGPDVHIDLEQLAAEAPRPIDPDYARLFVEDGWSTVGAVPENFEPWESAEAIAPSGAIPATFECEGWELVGPITPTDAERAEADRILEDLRGAGVLKYPRSMAIMSDNVCIEPALHDAMADMLAEPDAVTDATPAMTAVSTCIECGTEFEGTGYICSAGCGHALTGEYPPTYEKDYGDE